MPVSQHWMAFYDSTSILERNDNIMVKELLVENGLTLNPNKISLQNASKNTECHTNSHLNWFELQVHQVAAGLQTVEILASFWASTSKSREQPKT